MQVLNQYHFSPDSRTACVAISVMAIYHQYTNLDRTLGAHEWETIMARGTELYRRWRAQDAKQGNRLPTVQDVIAMLECKSFVQVFGSQPVEYAGLVCDANGVDQPEGSLRQMLHEMARLCRQEAKTVCCLLVLPHIICVSVLAVPARNGAPCELRFFDSHDTRSLYCDYRLFSEPELLLQYIMHKYPVSEWNESFISQQSIERVQASYGYSASMFIK